MKTSIGLRTSRLIVATLGLALLTGPTFADFANLRAMAPLLPSGKSPMAFVYTAPKGGFAVDSPVLYGPSERILATALFTANGVDPVTGVDFSKADSVLVIGDPPSELTVLAGQPGFLDGVPAALSARGFETSALGGLPVFAKGEDYAIDVTSARVADPLGRGMAKSQRLALGDDFMLRTTAWDEMNAAMASLEQTEPTPETDLWLQTIAAINAACGDCWLDAATGWHTRAFVGPGIDVTVMLDPTMLAERLEQARSENQLRLPPFPRALLALSQSADAVNVQIALPYGDADLAQLAADKVAYDIVFFPGVPATPTISIESQGDLSIAVLTVAYPLEEAAAARDLFADFNTAIMQRNFDALSITAF